MCCAKLSAALSRMAACWDRTSHSCIEMVFAVRDLMQDAYPELKETCGTCIEGVLAEETRFAHTMEVGLKKLEEDLQPLIESGRKDPTKQSVYAGDEGIQALRHVWHAA